MLFVKAAKVLALALALLPITGCSIGTGLIFAAYLRSIAYSPELEDGIFIYVLLGFALIETFVFILLGTMSVIYGF